MQMQLQIEKTFTSIAAATGRPSILILDRGILDNKGYVSRDSWAKAMRGLDDSDPSYDIYEATILERYDGVVHMCTAAKGAEKYYKWGWQTDDSGKKVYRRESPEQARELDDKMIACWKGHPRHIIIENQAGASFQVKLNAACAAVMDIALEKHPQHSPRKQ
mmetsp:Transcript_11041/g.21144  ORF Transcript_11041/g.21144 Transcript_11041/m.21144 type:complete len:162 (-) Transcript_11041:260-745(-)